MGTVRGSHNPQPQHGHSQSGAIESGQHDFIDGVAAVDSFAGNVILQS
jgi:hypothetical protein